MARAEAVIQVGRLVSAFGKDDVSEERVSIYVDNLCDIHEDLLRATVDSIIRGSKFFPSISEVRRTAAGLAGLLPPTPAEAMAIVRRADKCVPVMRRDGSVAYTEKFWEWPEDVSHEALELIREVLSRVGEPSDIDGNGHFGWDTGFQKTYETQAGTIEASVLKNLSVARLGSGQESKRIAG